MSTKIKLTQKEKEQLLKIKKTNVSSIIRDRAQTVLARNEELTIANIAKALTRDDKFIRNSIILYKQGALEVTNFVSNNYKLSKEKRKAIIKIIQTECPKDLKDFNFTTQFWSTDILKKVIKKKYKIEYKNIKSYHDLFKEAGFTFKKPKTKDFRQDPEKIKEFKGALKKSSKTTKIRLSW
ncbi:MAG: winged helix-turn-helix domain-containing protein [Patescibacteria group bacterium]|nr:winged helix-turn-helix domain-containing protein [Patescibacteria group bacterium]MBU1062876.1 winged helix-turn-helix domain-containing protein [Patescibacteria group bacterium]